MHDLEKPHILIESIKVHKFIRGANYDCTLDNYISKQYYSQHKRLLQIEPGESISLSYHA